MQLILKISIQSSHYVKYKATLYTHTYIHIQIYIYMDAEKKKIKQIFKYKHQIFYFNDWTEMLRLKCTTSRPELAVAVSWVTSAAYLPTHSGSGGADYSELSIAQTLCACYIHTVMHLETEHLADTPLLGLGQKGCPHKTYYHT